MRLFFVLLLVTIGLCSYSASALDLSGSLGNLIPLTPLKELLKTLGISVQHLVDGLQKCVAELGPEASEAVKKLLEALQKLL